jgi:hypothetical protein
MLNAQTSSPPRAIRKATKTTQVQAIPINSNTLLSKGGVGAGVCVSHLVVQSHSSSMIGRMLIIEAEAANAFSRPKSAPLTLLGMRSSASRPNDVEPTPRRSPIGGSRPVDCWWLVSP